MDKKVSIVMPLYNAQNCMERAVNSIMAQDYANWELVLVDDGSPDKSGEIADKLSLQYPDKIISVHEENKGQGGARNKGVEYATGDYLVFVDCDDEIEPDLLSFCVGRMERENADVLVFEYRMLDVGGRTVKTVKSPYGFSEIGNLKEDKSYLLLQGLACNKMFDMRFLRASGIVFKEKIRYEDLLFSTEILLRAQKILYSSRPLYRYYMSENSAMRNTDILRNRELLLVMDEMFAFFSENRAMSEYYDELCALTIDNVYIASTLRLLRIDRKSPLIKEFKRYLADKFPDYKKNKYVKKMSKQYRLTFFLLQHHMTYAVYLLTRIKDKKRG